MFLNRQAFPIWNSLSHLKEIAPPMLTLVNRKQKLLQLIYETWKHGIFEEEIFHLTWSLKAIRILLLKVLNASLNGKFTSCFNTTVHQWCFLNIPSFTRLHDIIIFKLQQLKKWIRTICSIGVCLHLQTQMAPQ